MRPTFDYEDFALRIDGQGDDLRVRLVRSPFGPREEPYSPPYTRTALTALLDSVERALTPFGSSVSEQAVRALGPVTSAPFSANLESLGDELFKSLFKGSILQCFFRSLSYVESRPNTGLRIRLELDPAQPELADLGAVPWELMYRAESRDYLSRNLLTPVVRYLDVSHLQTAAPPIRDELRILVLISSPDGMPPLDHESELERIHSAWGSRPDIRIVQPEQPTLRALRGLLRDTRPHVLHFIGHGVFDATTGHGSLVFEDAESKAHPVTGGLLAETLKIGHRIRLVFLNSCESGRLPRREGHDPYHGVASALLMGGVASVVSMQFPVSDQAAVAFSDSFYSALAAGDPIESAVVEGRLSVFQERPRSWEWATPALYLGAATGRIFHQPGPDSTQSMGKEMGRLARGLDLVDMKKYDAAEDEFTKILGGNPRNADAYYYLALSRVGGRNPRTQKLELVKKVEEDLRTATDLGGDQPHFLYLWALVKQEYYPWNGLRMPPPPIEELLASAERGPVEKAKLRQLLRHVPTSQNAVRRAVESALEEI